MRQVFALEVVFPRSALQVSTFYGHNLLMDYEIYTNTDEPSMRAGIASSEAS